VATADRARETVADGAAWVVVGLETLPSLAVLAAIVRALGRERVVFSLDLREGRPLALPSIGQPLHPRELVDRAVAAGAGTVLVLDLARIGTGAGADLRLVEAIRRAHQDVAVWVGGGVAGLDDLERLAAAGCDAALVATALHGGGLTPGDLDVVRRRPTAGHTVT
jgi:phosphoribosylformimino-5-aminoimidazole carboxamide ribotide isomerase